jgi:transposase-like protein
MLSRWRREYLERGEAAFSGGSLSREEELEARVVALERTCGQLALENAILKKGVSLAKWRSDTP